MKTLLVVTASLLLSASSAQAQFSIPLAGPYNEAAVQRENLQLGFISQRRADNTYVQYVDSLRTVVLGMIAKHDTLTLIKDATDFCKDFKATDEQCKDALSAKPLHAFLGDAPGAKVRKLTRTYIRSIIPTRGYNRAELGAYMRSSGGSESLAIASQFAANISDKEAYVVSNIVRGIAGRVIVSADYALVVVSSDTANPAVRDTVETDRANLVRAVNNGGTLVARFTAPMYARSGANISAASGLTMSTGFIGPLSDKDASKRHAAASVAGEFLGSLAIRGLTGEATPTAELIFGARTGITVSDAPLRSVGGYKDITYGQAVIGLRQSKGMSLSALITVSNHKFSDVLPRAVVNFSAVR